MNPAPPGIVRAAFRVLRLPAGERRRAVEAAVQLTRASIELRVLSPGRAVALLGTPHRDGPTERSDTLQLREAEHVGLAVGQAARRLPWHPTCLRQALAVQRMLQSRGIPCRLHLGVTGT